MTTITVNESDRIIIAESLEGWIEYRFSDIPGNEKEIYLHIETDRPALLWLFAFHCGERKGIQMTGATLRKLIKEKEPIS